MASPSAEPIPATSLAAEPTTSGTAITNDIPETSDRVSTTEQTAGHR
ncbi:hypothetical protein MPS_0161 [Mycobacterium pseudoshottsii JCM 15466]|nr:hypothetical protein MPS_0161 [Mycobacterium pseudoshottsii JCM 15466]